jgi:hypothetical protein
MANGQPISKVELQAVLEAALSGLSKELRAEFQTGLSALSKELRAEFQTGLSALSKELRAEFQAGLSAQSEELKEFSRQIETNLLTEFHRYAKGQQVRLHALESNGSDLVLRLATIEDRLLALESQRPPTPFRPSQPR